MVPAQGDRSLLPAAAAAAVAAAVARAATAVDVAAAGTGATRLPRPVFVFLKQNARCNLLLGSSRDEETNK